jgi:hypothetical protein
MTRIGLGADWTEVILWAREYLVPMRELVGLDSVLKPL